MPLDISVCMFFIQQFNCILQILFYFSCQIDSTNSDYMVTNDESYLILGQYQ